MGKWRKMAAGMAAGTAIVAAVATSAGGSPASLDDCLGLACPDGDHPVPEADGPTTTVSGPQELERQRKAGFYEYGLGSERGERAVAYVVPPGQWERVPASVRELPLVSDLRRETTAFEDGSTVLILDRHVFGAIPPETEDAGTATATASRTRAPRRRARAAAVDAYGCPEYYFCIYDSTSWQGARWGLHGNGTGWQSLAACCNASDRAESVRNRRNNTSLLNRNNPPTTGANDRYCSDSHSSDPDLGNNFGGGGRNVASAWANTADTVHC